MYAIFAYALLLLMVLFLEWLIWDHWVSGKLYICTDLGFPIFDMIPPFVHPGSDDAYLVPAWRVWLVWVSFMAAAFALPALIIRNISRREMD